ncbi:mechanosensitive ion channel [Alteromonadaceae bacterium BrNp21-10]|nr:mechanosensitive ion channel [Alteromonadaceae bacterium BrNp21-10]
MKIMVVLGAFLAYLLCTKVVAQTISRLGVTKKVKIYRVKYIIKTINIVLGLLFLVLLTFLLGIEYAQLSLFLSSVTAVLGVALFAQWSILSNVTASLIIFFAFPYRVGDKVKIIDGDVDIVGIIDEITMFHVILRNDSDVITYPNSMILQKAVIKLAKKKTAPVSATTEVLTEQPTPVSTKSN